MSGQFTAEQAPREDRLVLPPVHLFPIGNLADVQPVLEEMGERSHAKANAAAGNINGRLMDSPAFAATLRGSSALAFV
jgi:hypothetical protein